MPTQPTTKYRKLPVEVEAITFEELVDYGLQNCGKNIVNGMPWSFDYKGHRITHENDNCYLIPTLEGTMRFDRGDFLITGVENEIYPCKPDIFKKTYELLPTTNNLEGWGRLEDKVQHLLESFESFDVLFYKTKIIQFISSIRKHDMVELIKISELQLSPLMRKQLIKEYYENN